jgi:hypothetical protein
MALAVDPTDWALCGVLIEPARRIGLGKWVPPNLIRSDSGERLRMQLASADFDELEDAESSTIEEGVRSSYTPYGFRSPDVFRRAVTPLAPPGRVVLSSRTPIVDVDGDEITLGGVITSGYDQVQRLLLLRQRLIGRSEFEVPARSATLTDRGIRVDH